MLFVLQHHRGALVIQQLPRNKVKKWSPRLTWQFIGLASWCSRDSLQMLKGRERPFLSVPQYASLLKLAAILAL